MKNLSNTDYTRNFFLLQNKVLFFFEKGTFFSNHNRVHVTDETPWTNIIGGKSFDNISRT
jgi:hypothetical protein